MHEAQPFSLADYLARQKAWSERPAPDGFGPGDRTGGVVQHIQSELNEILEAPFGSQERLVEFCDVIILALDGVWRNGFTAEQLVDALEAKQAKNKNRKWPEMPPDQASFHVRGNHD